MHHAQNAQFAALSPAPSPTEERERLVRWCVRLTGDPLVAEDLAQEALLIAWQREADLRDPEKRFAWLMGIARNLCMNWHRRHAQDDARLADLDPDRVLPGAVHEPSSIGDPELVLDLERQELAELLDRALALLPGETRDLLIYRYINESPHADIARRYGLSEGAVKVRLHRGRLALRRLFTTDLRQDALAYGLDIPDADADEIQETRIWCPCCGRHRLEGSFDGTLGNLRLQCPGCGDRPPGFRSVNEGIERIKGLRSYKAALSRLFAGDPLRAALERGVASCRKCGRVNPVKMGPPDTLAASWDYPYAVSVVCQECGSTTDTVLQGLALGLPETIRFWRNNPRMHVLPPREIEAEGNPALVTSFASISDSNTLDIVFSRTTFTVMSVDGQAAD
jgi:RNA polymerase sigma-70 factor (ECF subfamily)